MATSFRTQAVAIGFVWLALTVAFEFFMGRNEFLLLRTQQKLQHKIAVYKTVYKKG